MLTDQKIDEMLIDTQTDHLSKYPDLYIRHYLEQYRVYLRAFTSMVERRQKSNEFFLSINTAIMAVLGYIETQAVPIVHSALIFSIVPFIGIVICYSWALAVRSYRQVAQAKYKVIHRLERRLPAALFETEWEILGRGKDPSRYYPLSRVEKNIPLIFILLYLVIFLANSPLLSLLQNYR